MPVPGPDLPAAVRIAPHRGVLRRGLTGRQIGLDPRTALAVDDLAEPLAAMVDELECPVAPAELIARAVRRGAGAAEAEALLRALLGTGAVVDAAAPLLRSRRRAAAAVLVAGEGPLSCGLVTGLVQAGVGSVQVRTTGAVQRGDLGTGHVESDRGRPRAEGLVAAARRLVPAARVGPDSARQRPDLAVLTDALAVHPVQVAALQTAGVAHLPVRLRDGLAVVGPLVFPGRTACLGCLDRHRADRDPGWPGVAAQLTGLRGHGDPAAVAAAVALGTAQALAALDGQPGTAPPAVGATLELDPVAGTLLRRDWPPRSDCPCGAHRAGATAAPGSAGGAGVPEATCAATVPRETITG
ncbi:MAG TPA: TOMM precursor leader peptide-binding protein [Pseudonocardia sp.]|nr:TOMM precursor leader peptide-binding protein [Pseudonocardia sp.]